MSGDFVTDVCPAYAVVDVKKNIAGNVQKADFAVVDRTKKKKVSPKRNDDKKDFLNDEVAQAVREESQLTCSTFHQEKIYDVPVHKSSSVGDYTKEKGIKWKSAMIIVVYLLGTELKFNSHHYVYVISCGHSFGYYIMLCWYIFLCTLK